MMINVGLAVHVGTFTPYLLSLASQRQLGMALAMDGGGAFLAGLWLARRKPMLDFERTIMVAAFLVRDRFAVSVGLRDLFKCPTVATLARRLDERGKAGPAAIQTPPIRALAHRYADS